MKKVFATLFVGMLAVFSFAAFEVTGGYSNLTLDAEVLGTVSDINVHGVSGGISYLFEGLGIEGGALLIGGSVDYYFPSEIDEVLLDGEVIDITDAGLSMNLTLMSFGANGGYRQSLNTLFPDLAFGMYVQGLFNYSWGTVTIATSDISSDSLSIDVDGDSSSLGFGGGVGTSFAIQNLNMNMGADLLFEKVTITSEGTDYESDKWKPKFKVYAGLQF